MLYMIYVGFLLHYWKQWRQLTNVNTEVAVDTSKCWPSDVGSHFPVTLYLDKSNHARSFILHRPELFSSAAGCLLTGKTHILRSRFLWQRQQWLHSEDTETQQTSNTLWFGCHTKYLDEQENSWGGHAGCGWEVSETRATLCELLDAIFCLVKQNLTFRGSSSKVGSASCGSSLALIALTSKYNSMLSGHLSMCMKGIGHEMYLSDDIRNEPVNLAAEFVIRSLTKFTRPSILWSSLISQQMWQIEELSCILLHNCQ